MRVFVGGFQSRRCGPELPSGVNPLALPLREPFGRRHNPVDGPADPPAQGRGITGRIFELNNDFATSVGDRGQAGDAVVAPVAEPHTDRGRGVAGGGGGHRVIQSAAELTVAGLPNLGLHYFAALPETEMTVGDNPPWPITGDVNVVGTDRQPIGLRRTQIDDVGPV